MPSSLFAQASPPPVSIGVPEHTLTWWFWVKAGMGFTIGAMIVGACAWFVVITFMFSVARQLLFGR